MPRQSSTVAVGEPFRPALRSREQHPTRSDGPQRTSDPFRSGSLIVGLRSRSTHGPETWNCILTGVARPHDDEDFSWRGLVESETARSWAYWDGLEAIAPLQRGMKRGTPHGDPRRVRFGQRAIQRARSRDPVAALGGPDRAPRSSRRPIRSTACCATVAGSRLMIPAVSLLAETLLPHMKEQADAWQSSHAIMSKHVTITPMTVQSRSCPSTLSISSSLVSSLREQRMGRSVAPCRSLDRLCDS